MSLRLVRFENLLIQSYQTKFPSKNFFELVTKVKSSATRLTNRNYLSLAIQFESSNLYEHFTGAIKTNRTAKN